MDQWIGWLLPIGVSVISAVFTGMFMAGRNVEKMKTMDEIIKHQEQAIMELVERIAILEGKTSSK